METKEGVFYEYNHEYYKGFLREDEEELLEVNSSSGYKNVTVITDIPKEVLEKTLRELFMNYEGKSEAEMISVFFTDIPEKIFYIKNNLITNNSGFKNLKYKNLIESDTIHS